jgi:hypothetical protein
VIKNFFYRLESKSKKPRKSGAGDGIRTDGSWILNGQGFLQKCGDPINELFTKSKAGTDSVQKKAPHNKTPAPLQVHAVVRRGNH